MSDNEEDRQEKQQQQQEKRRVNSSTNTNHSSYPLHLPPIVSSMFASSPLRAVDSIHDEAEWRQGSSGSRRRKSTNVISPNKPTWDSELGEVLVHKQEEEEEEDDDGASSLASFTDMSSLLLVAPPTNYNSSTHNNNSNNNTSAKAVLLSPFKGLACGTALWGDPNTVHHTVTDHGSFSTNSSTTTYVSLLEDREAMDTWIQTNPTFIMNDEQAAAAAEGEGGGIAEYLATTEDTSRLNQGYFHNNKSIITTTTNANPTSVIKSLSKPKMQPSLSSTATETADDSCDLTEVESAANISHGTYQKQIEIFWDTSVVPNTTTATRQGLPLPQEQPTPTNTTNKKDTPTSSTTNSSSSVFGWMYNLIFTQCAGGVVTGTDIGLCSPTNISNIIKPSTTKHSQRKHDYATTETNGSTTSTLGRAETTSSEKLGIIAPPVILRRPTNPNFIPNDTTTKNENLAKSSTSASF